MNRALLVPCVASIALAAVAAAEVSAGAPEAPVAIPRPVIRPGAANMPPWPDATRLGDTIVARPLFSADRRPAAAASMVGAARALPRLSAIMIGDGIRAVVFDDDGKPLVAREGGHAGPYLVISIAADRVGVLGATGRQTLRPTPLASPGEDTAAPSAAAPSEGLSLLQQLQRGQVPHYAVPPPSAIQNLIARMRAQH